MHVHQERDGLDCSISDFVSSLALIIFDNKDCFSVELTRTASIIESLFTMCSLWHTVLPRFYILCSS